MKQVSVHFRKGYVAEFKYERFGKLFLVLVKFRNDNCNHPLIF